MYSQVVQVIRKFLNLRVVMRLELLDERGVLGANEVDSCTLATEASGSSDSVDVLLLPLGQFVIDDQLHLLDIDSSGKDVGSNQDSHSPCSELLHNDITFCLIHLTVHGVNNVIIGGHASSDLFHTLLSVTEDDTLVDVHVTPEVLHDINLPAFFLTGHIILINSRKCQFSFFDQNFDRVIHKMCRQFQSFRRQSC